MKKLSIPALALLALGLVIAIGAATFLGPCVHEDGSFGACHWAGRALTGLGGVTAALGLLALTMNGGRRAGLFWAALPVAVMGILTPGTLISICKSDAMRCRMVMRPAMLVLFALVILAAIIGGLTSHE